VYRYTYPIYVKPTYLTAACVSQVILAPFDTLDHSLRWRSADRNIKGLVSNSRESLKLRGSKQILKQLSPKLAKRPDGWQNAPLNLPSSYLTCMKAIPTETNKHCKSIHIVGLDRTRSGYLLPFVASWSGCMSKAR